jgi:beta-mannosidase
MHNLDLPAPVKVDGMLSGADGAYAVTLRSPVLARSVFVSFGDLEVQTLDNYFDLLPGEAVTVKLKAPSTVTLEQMKSAMQIISLTDAFPAAETMH